MLAANKQWNHLVQQARNERLSHALLLIGQNREEKLHFAKGFAEYLLCENPIGLTRKDEMRGKNERETGVYMRANEDFERVFNKADRFSHTSGPNEMACGQCQSCHWYVVGSHPDLFILQPEADNKLIKIEQIRELIVNLSQTPHCKLGRQVAIISPAEAMNLASANALLKTLEEPMGNVCFLLISETPSLLPATIRSRCQAIIFEWQLPILSLQTQTLFEGFVKLLNDELNPSELAEQWAKISLADIVVWYLYLLTDLIKLYTISEKQFLIYPNYRLELEKIKNKLAFSKLFHLLDQAYAAHQLVLKRSNVNTQLFLEDLLIECLK